MNIFSKSLTLLFFIFTKQRFVFLLLIQISFNWQTFYSSFDQYFLFLNVFVSFRYRNNSISMLYYRRTCMIVDIPTCWAMPHTRYYWSMPHPIALCPIPLSYAPSCWAMPHPIELCPILLIYTPSHWGYTDKRQNDKLRKRQTSEWQTSEWQTSERTNVGSDKRQKGQTSETTNVRWDKRQKDKRQKNVGKNVRKMSEKCQKIII